MKKMIVFAGLMLASVFVSCDVEEDLDQLIDGKKEELVILKLNNSSKYPESMSMPTFEQASNTDAVNLAGMYLKAKSVYINQNPTSYVNDWKITAEVQFSSKPGSTEDGVVELIFKFSGETMVQLYLVQYGEGKEISNVSTILQLTIDDMPTPTDFVLELLTFAENNNWEPVTY